MKRLPRAVAPALFLLPAVSVSAAALQEEPVQELLSYGGLVRAFWSFSDATIATGGGDPVLAVFLEDVQPYFELAYSDALVRVQLELAGGTAVLEDGWVGWDPPDLMGFKTGQFKPRVLHSASADPETLVFRDRTLLGERFDYYDRGAELSGGGDAIHWFLAVTDGQDGDKTGVITSARIEWSVYEEELGLAEGARDSPNYLRAEFGFFGLTDSASAGSAADGGGYGMDFAMTLGPYYLHTEFAHLGNSFPDEPIFVDGNPAVFLAPDSTPFGLTFGKRLGEDWQTSFRWQIADDAVNTKYLGLAVNFFPNAGAVTFTSDVSRYEADGPEGWVFNVGVSVGASRPRDAQVF